MANIRVVKTFNNNVMLAKTSKHEEIILIGKGIAYGLKPNDIVDETRIEKRFKLDSKEAVNHYVELLNSIPESRLDLTKKIIEYAEKELGVTFHESIFIGLVDHISYAIDRYKEGQQMSNALLWEIQRFYQKEYKVAKGALKIIEEEEHVILNDDEAGFIAMHFVNEQTSDNSQDAIMTAKTINDILTIVRMHFKMDLDENSMAYTRFITHIRYFLHRTQTISNEDDFLFNQVKTKYPETYECVKRIRVYLLESLDISLTNEEMLYFMLHVHRLTQRERSK